MKAREIRELSIKELQERFDAEKEHYNRMKINHSISPLDNPSQINVTRKNIARMATDLRQRQLKGEN